MVTKNLTLDTFASAMGADGIVFVDFWAAWCRQCRAFAPTFERASEQHPDIVFGKVDTEAEKQLSSDFRITSIPTLMVFRDGVAVHAQPGALVPAQRDQLVQGARPRHGRRAPTRRHTRQAARSLSRPLLHPPHHQKGPSPCAHEPPAPLAASQPGPVAASTSRTPSTRCPRPNAALAADRRTSRLPRRN